MAKKKKIEAPSIIKIEILLPVAGKFNLSYDVGKVYEVNANIANELIEYCYAKQVN